MIGQSECPFWRSSPGEIQWMYPAFKITHQLTGCTSKSLTPQNLWINFCLETRNKQKTVIFMFYTCYYFVSWTEDFHLKLNLGIFLDSPFLLLQPPERSIVFGFGPGTLWTSRQNFLSKSEINRRTSINSGNLLRKLNNSCYFSTKRRYRW